MAIRLLKASWAGLAGAGALEPAAESWPEACEDRGVFRPELTGDGVGWREGKEANALEEFMGGFFWLEVDEVEVDQSMPARSSILCGCRWRGREV